MDSKEVKGANEGLIKVGARNNDTDNAGDKARLGEVDQRPAGTMSSFMELGSEALEREWPFKPELLSWTPRSDAIYWASACSLTRLDALVPPAGHLGVYSRPSAPVYCTISSPPT